jgi:large subunit ribosomal protein L49
MSFLRPILRPASLPHTSLRRFASSGRPHKKPRYFIPRNANGNLPVYTDIRNNGTRDFTLIRNVQGEAYVSPFNSTSPLFLPSAQVLATDIRITLFRCANPAKAVAKVETNGQEIVITGAKWKPDIIKWLEARGF